MPWRAALHLEQLLCGFAELYESVAHLLPIALFSCEIQVRFQVGCCAAEEALMLRAVCAPPQSKSNFGETICNGEGPLMQAPRSAVWNATTSLPRILGQAERLVHGRLQLGLGSRLVPALSPSSHISTSGPKRRAIPHGKPLNKMNNTKNFKKSLNMVSCVLRLS